jgi:tetratricopeptide (TPR) repeat protein
MLRAPFRSACGAWCTVLVWVLPVAPVAGVELAVIEDGSAAQFTTLGNMELGQGRYETAIGNYRKALAVDKTYFWATYNLGLAYQQLGQLDEAATWYGKALAQSPDHPEVLCNLGWLAWRAGKFQEAADRFQDAARLAVTNPADAAQYWTNAGTAREGLQQWEAAARAYQEALALDGKSYQAHYNLGTLYLGHLNGMPGAAERAQAHLQQAVELAPERPDAWLNLAQSHEFTGAAEPKIAYDKALEAATGPYAKMRNVVRWQRALWFNRCVPPQKVAMREELKQILADDPDYPSANGLLGTYFYQIGEFEKAVTYLEREVAPGHDDTTNPIDLESHYLLAVIYSDHRPDPAKAIAHATAYYQQRPDEPKIHELRRRALRLSSAVAESNEPAAPEKAEKSGSSEKSEHMEPGAAEGGASRPEPTHPAESAPAGEKTDAHPAEKPASHGEAEPHG